MNFLIDMPLSPQLVPWLQERGHNAVHALGLGMSTADDSTLMALALDQERILVTADLDFPQAIALSHAQGPPLILFRGGNYSEAQMRGLFQRVLDNVPDAELKRSVTVVDRVRIRRTRLPLQPVESQDDQPRGPGMEVE